MIKIYGIKNCDTIKKTLKWFEANNLEYQFIDYKKTPPDASLAKAFIDALGWETVINKRGTTWRKLDDKTKAAVTEDSAVSLIIKQPSMIKRPIIEQNGQFLIGYNETQFAQFI
jgi:arsenate reductase